MLKAAILGERKAGLLEVPDPKPKENWVVVKVHAAPMCAEYKGFLKGWESTCLGHEAAGEVVAVAQPCRVKVGDRVVVMPQYACGKCALCVSGEYIHCQQGKGVKEFTGSPEGEATMAQYLLKPDWLLPKIPDGVSYEHGALACCALGPSYGAFRRMNVRATDTVLITGIGPVGLGAVVNARYLGAKVLAAEFAPERVKRAQEMGATVVDPRDAKATDKIRELTGGVGVDCALDCAGNIHAERLCIDATRRKGQVTYVGECQEELKIRVSDDLIRKGLTVSGSWHYNMAWVPEIMQVIQKSPLLEKLVTNVIPMSRIQEAFETSASQQGGKIILKPWE
ncbi:MAG: zinc-binding dehydrogenase [Planctomycetes bacterium]|nr:zinc-binding dehydrogenase [Planctomycetota bacterium]